MGEEGAPVDWMLDLAIALIFLALFVFSTFNFIGKADFGTGYFKEFHSEDLASITEIALAAPGDVTVRYDNIKESALLSVKTTNGVVEVGEYLDGEMKNSGKGYFGKAPSFTDTLAITPKYLVIQHSEGRASINNVLGELEGCPLIEDAKEQPIELALRGAVTETSKEDIKRIFSENMREYGLRTGEGFLVTIEMVAGNSNEITSAPSGREARALSCYFSEQLSTLASLDFETDFPEGTSGSAYIKITTSSDVNINDRQIANALSLAVVRLYG